MKQTSRRVILRKRNRLSKEDIDKKSSIIKERLFNSEEYKNAKVVMFYASFGSEVDTFEMIKEALKEKKVCVPIMNEEGLIAALIKDIKELSNKSKYGIPEPSNIKEIDKRNIDLVIVPGVVFDKRNHRIGYGKGYYDKFLKDFKGKKIGLAFKMQILEIIPNHDWDVRLDNVISET